MIVVPKDNAYGKASDGNVIFSSYRFLDGSRLSSLPTEDVEYLISKRCLHFPRKDVLDKFVGQYFAMVHPFVPLLDEAEFWRIYNGSGTKKVSLLVFQAILFSACCVRVSSQNENPCKDALILTTIPCPVRPARNSPKVWVQ